MADIFVQACFAFTCSNAEMALLEEAFALASDLGAGDEPPPPTAEFAALFPPTSADDIWSGFRGIFCDADFIDMGAEIEGGNSIAAPLQSTVTYRATVHFNPNRLPPSSSDAAPKRCSSVRSASNGR